MPSDKQTANEQSEVEPSRPEPVQAYESGSSAHKDAVNAFYDAIRIDGHLKEGVQNFLAWPPADDGLQRDFHEAATAFMDAKTVKSPSDECSEGENDILAACHHYDSDAAAHEHALQLTKFELSGTLSDRVTDWHEAIMVYDDSIDNAKIDLRYAIEAVQSAHANAIGDEDSKSREEHLRAKLRVNILAQMRIFQTAVNTASQTLMAAATQMLHSQVEYSIKTRWAQGDFVDNMALADEAFWQSLETIRDD